MQVCCMFAASSRFRAIPSDTIRYGQGWEGYDTKNDTNVQGAELPKKSRLRAQRLLHVGDRVAYDEIVFPILHICNSSSSGWFFSSHATTSCCSSAAVLIANSSSCVETLPAES